MRRMPLENAMQERVHNPKLQLSVGCRFISIPHRTRTFCKGEPSVWDREGHEDNDSPAFAVVKATIPEATDTENLLPRNVSDVHPSRPCEPTGQLLCCVHERYG